MVHSPPSIPKVISDLFPGFIGVKRAHRQTLTRSLHEPGTRRMCYLGPENDVSRLLRRALAAIDLKECLNNEAPEKGNRGIYHFGSKEPS
jgi:hypothetical protein